MVKISIVLAVYNGAADVCKCLESLINQTYKNIEILCVDDGSTDNTMEILSRYARADNRIKVFSQGENKKLLLAVKCGVSESTGDYIMFVDDDDWYELNACEKVAEIAASKQPDIIHYGTKFYSTQPIDSGKKVRLEKRVLSHDFEYSGENSLHLNDKIEYIYLWTRAVKADVCKRAYNAIPDVEMNFYSDTYACKIFHYYGKSVVSISEKLVNHIYDYGLATQMMTAKNYATYMKTTSLFEKGVRDFFRAQGEIDELHCFEEEYENRVSNYIRKWRNRVADSDSVEAFNSLLEYFGPDVVLPLLHKDYYKLHVKLEKSRMKLEKTKKQLEKAKTSPKKKSIISRIKRKIKSLLK